MNRLTVEIHAIPGHDRKTKEAVWRCPNCRRVLARIDEDLDLLALPLDYARVDSEKRLWAPSEKYKRHPRKDRTGIGKFSRGGNQASVAFESLKERGFSHVIIESAPMLGIGHLPLRIRCLSPCRTICKIESIQHYAGANN